MGKAGRIQDYKAEVGGAEELMSLLKAFKPRFKKNKIM